MKFPRHIWEQLKNKTPNHLISALKKDGWRPDRRRGAVQVYLHSDGRRVTIHFHSKGSYPPKLLQGLLTVIGWTEKDLRRVKLIK